MRAACIAGTPTAKIEQDAEAELQSLGFTVDYAEIRSATLAPASRAMDKRRVALIAAFLGRTRLIDNLEFEIP
jgi:pantoate--beta-alanine ligase